MFIIRVCGAVCLPLFLYRSPIFVAANDKRNPQFAFDQQITIQIAATFGKNLFKTFLLAAFAIFTHL